MDTRLTWIRALHTAVWLFFNAVMAYLYYAVMTDRVGIWAWIGLGLFGVECLVLVVYRMSCPLTLMARKYTDSTRSNFDIWLPEWLARYNKWIYGILLMAVTIGVLWRVVW